jgi:hypothetical protein
MATDNNNDGPPPIEPVQKKTILKNETPAFVSTAASGGREFRFFIHKRLQLMLLMFFESLQ